MVHSGSTGSLQEEGEYVKEHVKNHRLTAMNTGFTGTCRRGAVEEATGSGRYLCIAEKTKLDVKAEKERPGLPG